MKEISKLIRKKQKFLRDKFFQIAISKAFHIIHFRKLVNFRVSRDKFPLICPKLAEIVKIYLTKNYSLKVFSQNECNLIITYITYIPTCIHKMSFHKNAEANVIANYQNI